MQVSYDGKCVKVGKGMAKIAILYDPTVLAGDIIGGGGHELRDWLIRNPDAGAVVVADDPTALPARVECLIAAGKAARQYLRHRAENITDGKFCHADKTIFISPPFYPNDVPYTLMRETEVKIVTGEFVASLPPGYSQELPWVTIVPGCELYIPGWPAFTLKWAREVAP